jgi:hypothetical protein
MSRGRSNPSATNRTPTTAREGTGRRFGAAPLAKTEAAPTAGTETAPDPRFACGLLVQPVDHAFGDNAPGSCQGAWHFPAGLSGLWRLPATKPVHEGELGSRGVLPHGRSAEQAELAAPLTHLRRRRSWRMPRAEGENARSASAGSSDRARRAKRLGVKPWGGGRRAPEKLDLPAGFG